VAYATLLGASLGDNLVAMSEIFNGNARIRNSDTPLAMVIPPACFLRDVQGWGQLLEGMARHYVPVSDWLQKTLWNALADQFASKEAFEKHFDCVEVVLALACHWRRDNGSTDWFPPGCFGHRLTGRQAAVARIRDSLESEKGESEYVKSGLFGALGDCEAGLAKLETFSNKLGWDW
jgi:hypothetical protein